MALSFDDMLKHGNRRAIVHELARRFVERHEADPRLSAVFGTQQRWLLAHAAMAIYFRGKTGDGGGLHSSAYLELVETQGLAARHTAHAFLKEMINYGIARYDLATMGQKRRLIELSDAAIAAISFWLLVHLQALDAFDGGSRGQRFQLNPTSLAVLQPALAERLMVSPGMRVPKGAFSLFTWLNNGGLVMDWLMLGLGVASEETDRIPTRVTSISEIAERLRLSRTHLGRKLRDAEELGSIGWLGRRGKSVMWLSADFRAEYERYQVGKLLIIDAAFEATVSRLGR